MAMVMYLKTIAIIASPGSESDHLLGELNQLPGYAASEISGDSSHVIRSISNQVPNLVIIESSYPAVWPLLRQLNAAWPEIVTIILAKNIWQKIHAQDIGCSVAVSAMPLSDPHLLSIIQRSLEANIQTMNEPLPPLQT